MACINAKALLILMDIVFWLLASVCSFWYGQHAVEALDVGYLDRVRIESSIICQRHERWFNFLGSLVGWLALWTLLYRLFVRCVSVQAVDLGLIIISFLGISGYLPYMIKYKTTLAK